MTTIQRAVIFMAAYFPLAGAADVIRPIVVATCLALATLPFSCAAVVLADSASSSRSSGKLSNASRASDATMT